MPDTKTAELTIGRMMSSDASADGKYRLCLQIGTRADGRRIVAYIDPAALMRCISGQSIYIAVEETANATP